jgi:WhiB family redox-sensing transcriptional regulator
MARQAALESLMASDVEVLLAQLVSRPEWHRRAACRGVGPDLFFPARSDGRPVQGLAYCERCPVRQECLTSAQELASTSGVWGGTTGRQRREIRRQRVA